MNENDVTPSAWASQGVTSPRRRTTGNLFDFSRRTARPSREEYDVIDNTAWPGASEFGWTVKTGVNAFSNLMMSEGSTSAHAQCVKVTSQHGDAGLIVQIEKCLLSDEWTDWWAYKIWNAICHKHSLCHNHYILMWTLFLYSTHATWIMTNLMTTKVVVLIQNYARNIYFISHFLCS